MLNKSNIDDVEIIRKDRFFPTKFIGKIEKHILIKEKRVKIRTVFLIRIILSLILFGIISWWLPLLICYLTNEKLFTSWQIILAFSWVPIGPILIDIFEYSIDNFHENIKPFLRYNKIKGQLNSKIEKKMFNQINPIFFTIFVFFFDIWAIQILFSEKSIYLQIFIYFQAIIGAYMWGIVVWLIFYTIYFVNWISKQDLIVNPFHPDSFGGLSIIGNLTIWATALLSTVSLYFPYGLAVVRESSNKEANNFLFGGFIFLIVFILITFFIPLLSLNRLARNKKLNLLQKHGKEIDHETSQLNEKDVSINQYLKTLLKFERYKKIERMNVWPFDWNVIIALIGSILLPVIIFILEYINI